MDGVIEEGLEVKNVYREGHGVRPHFETLREIQSRHGKDVSNLLRLESKEGSRLFFSFT